MTDLREQLNRRRDFLRQSAGEDSRYVQLENPGDARYQRAARNLAELREVESAIVTYQLADAQLEVASAQREVAQSQRDANAQADSERSRQEEIAHWTRRLVTTFSIANAAGLVATLNFCLSKDSPAVPAYEVETVLAFFVIGATIGLAAPAFRIWGLLNGPRKRPESFKKYAVVRLIERVADHDWILYATMSAACFAFSLVLILGIAQGYYGAKRPNNLSIWSSTSTARPPASASPAPVVMTAPPPADPG